MPRGRLTRVSLRERSPETKCEPSLEPAFVLGGAWYVAPRREPVAKEISRATFAAIAASVVLGACGGGARQDANEPSGIFPVAVPIASFPAFQRLAQRTHLVIAVRNAGSKTIPNVAVTITNP